MDLKKLQPIMDAYKQVQEKAKMDPVDPKELKGKLSDRKDKDINNDGKVDDTDSYLHNRRKTIKKAMKKDDQSETETQVSEESMTDAQMKKREKYVLAMKDKMPEFKKKYGDRAKEVMYATATKMAMKEEAELNEKAYVSSLSPGLGRKGSHDVIGKDGKVVKSYPYTKDGMKAAQAHLSKMKEEVELDEASIYSQLAKMAGTPKNPDKGSALAHLAKSKEVQKVFKDKKLKKEEVEQVNELSKKTLGSYVKKAKADNPVTQARKDYFTAHGRAFVARGTSDFEDLNKTLDQKKKDFHQAELKRKSRLKNIKLAKQKMAKEEVEQIEEDITKMSDARLKFHAVKKFPHGSYTRKEVDDEHKRRLKTVPNYHTVKPSLNEARKEEVDHKKGATKPETMDDKMTASDKKFIQPHGTLNGNDSGIDGEKAAQQTVDSIKSSSKGPKTRPNDKNVGDRNAEVPADVTKRAGVKEAKTFEDLMKKLGGLE